MPRAYFGGQVDYSYLFADLYEQDANEGKKKVDEIQDAADSDMYDKWQNDLISDAEWLAYINTRKAATLDDVTEHQRWVELERQVATHAKKKAEADAEKAARDAEIAAAEAEQAAEEAKRAAAQQQAAEDADMQSQWEEGLISDDEWLEYIRGRVASSAGSDDPKEHQGWVEAEREYTRYIEDSSMLAQYEAHEISASQYIAYKQNVLAGLEQDSAKADTLKKEITDLIDSTYQSDVVARSDEIISQIKAGSKTLDDLLKYYTEAKANARPGSELESMLSEKINETNGEIHTRNREGAINRVKYMFESNQITGKQAGQQIRAIAEKYDKSDEATYFNTLSSALTFEQYPGFYKDGEGKTGGGGGGGGGGGRRSSGGGGGAKRPSTAKAIDKLEADITRAIDLTGQANQRYAAGEDAPTVTDTATGKPITLDKKTLHQIQVAGLEAYDAKAKIQDNAGKKDDAARTRQRKTEFIEKAVWPVNTIDPADLTRTTVTAIVANITDAAANSTDPNAAQRAAKKGAEQLDRIKRQAVTTEVKTYNPTGPKGEDRFIHDVGTVRNAPARAQDQVMPDLVNDLDNAIKALNIVADPKTTPEQGANAIKSLYSNQGTTRGFLPGASTPSGGEYGFVTLDDLAPALDAVNAAKTVTQGLAKPPGSDGALTMGVYVATSGPNAGKLVRGPVPYISTTVRGPDGLPIQQFEPDLGQDPNAGEHVEKAWLNENGMPAPVWVVQRPLPSPYKVWVATQPISFGVKDPTTGEWAKDANGDYIQRVFFPGEKIPSEYVTKDKDGNYRSAPPDTEGTGENAREVPGTTWDVYMRSGAVTQEPLDIGIEGTFLPGYEDNGARYDPTTWYYVPQTGKWVRESPYMAEPVGDGTIKWSIGENGQPDLSVRFKPNADAGGVSAPYVGNNARAMQTVADAQYPREGLTINNWGEVVAGGDRSDEYYSPDLAELSRQTTAHHGAIFDDDYYNPAFAEAKKAKSRREQAEEERVKRTSAKAKDIPQTIPDDPMEALAQTAAMFGIRGVGPALPNVQAPRTPQPPAKVSQAPTAPVISPYNYQPPKTPYRAPTNSAPAYQVGAPPIAPRAATAPAAKAPTMSQVPIKKTTSAPMISVPVKKPTNREAAEPINKPKAPAVVQKAPVGGQVAPKKTTAPKLPPKTAPAAKRPGTSPNY